MCLTLYGLNFQMFQNFLREKSFRMAQAFFITLHLKSEVLAKVDPSISKATFVQSTRMQRFLTTFVHKN